MRINRLLALSLAIAGPVVSPALSAQATPRQAPASSTSLDGGFVLGGDWLQGNAMPLERKTMHSASFDLAWRRQGWSFDAGFMRIARDLSTVQGGTASVGRLVHLGPVLLIPSVGVLAGQAAASRDSTGYDYVNPQGGVGHVPRYGYSDGFSFGGGVNLTIEVPVYRALGVRVMAGEWFFSGSPLENDRARTVVGAGLSLRVRR